MYYTFPYYITQTYNEMLHLKNRLLIHFVNFTREGMLVPVVGNVQEM